LLGKPSNLGSVQCSRAARYPWLTPACAQSA